MDKKRRLFLIIAFIFFCAGLGFHSGVVAKSLKQPLLWNSDSIFVPESLPLSQTDRQPIEGKVLFIFDFTTDGAPFALGAVWYAVYHSGIDQLYWFPVYPQLGVFHAETNALLEQAYQHNVGGGLDPAFLRTLQEVTQTRWDAVILLRSSDLIEIVDDLAYLEWEGMQLNGEQVLQHLTQKEANRSNELTKQGKFLEAFCQRRDEVRDQPHVLENLAQRLYQKWSNDDEFDSNAKQVLELFLKLMLQKDPLPCEFIGV